MKDEKADEEYCAVEFHRDVDQVNAYAPRFRNEEGHSTNAADEEVKDEERGGYSQFP